MTLCRLHECGKQAEGGAYCSAAHRTLHNWRNAAGPKPCPVCGFDVRNVPRRNTYCSAECQSWATEMRAVKARAAKWTKRLVSAEKHIDVLHQEQAHLRLRARRHGA